MEKKILIVDDAMFMRKVIKDHLAQCGYQEVAEAKDGMEAVEKFHEYKPDLVLLDITMPGISGLEVLEAILKEDPEAKVVMCSAVGLESIIQKAIILGAADFIVKPFKKEEFQRVVEAQLRS